MRPCKRGKIGKRQGILCYLIIAVALVLDSQVASAQTGLPGNADRKCVVTDTEFEGWRTNGSFVHPNSVKFPDDADECTFFKWAEHMFLWVTSRPSQGSAGSYVFDSSPFYSVSPPGRDTKRTLIAQGRSSPSQRKLATVSVSQLGPGGEPVLFSNTSSRHPIVRIEGDVRPRAEKAGLKIEIGRVDIERDKPPRFYDTKGDLIEDPILRDVSGQVIEIKPPPGNTIVSSGRRFLLDRSGRAIAVEPGQADQHVLMAQGDKLVYYMIHVNDVYAYFLTGRKNNRLRANLFPTSDGDMGPIRQYARDHGLASFPDDSALIVELKSSWIELPDDKSYDDYVSIEADVPDFRKTSDELWENNGWRPGVKLAMVGMHVVFSVKGHPELIWATFEHKHATPNARYQYDDALGEQPWSQQSCGEWHFSSGHAEPDVEERPCYGTTIDPCTLNGQTVNDNGRCVDANRARMYLKGDDIHAYDKETIGPSDILRLMAWGNSEFRETFTTRIISINHSIQDRLASGDVRKNYYMIGATWLSDPVIARDLTDCEAPVQGSNCLANSTMETFHQPSNCLLCHRDPSDMLGGVSRVYVPIDPLFPDR
jgi:hypothetical protein